jgi:putative DNA primase/helicase
LPAATGFHTSRPGVLYPPTPDYFNVIASSVHYDPDAPQPVLWLHYLEQVLDDAEAIVCLQDWMGYLLTPDTSQQKILFVEGPKRSGKGTWARIIGALLGKQSVAGPTMSSLSETSVLNR